MTVLTSKCHTVTKEEMKGMIKEGSSPIINILIGKEKEMTHTQTQTDNEVIKQQNEQSTQKGHKIQRIEEVMEYHQ